MTTHRLKHAPELFMLLLVGLIAAGCIAPVNIEWATETEINTAGFNIYRGDTPTGPFDVKVNDQLIPGSPDPMIGGKYSYTDKTTQIGRLYYYQLEEVEQNGTVSQVGVTPARAGGFDWRLGLVLGGLAATVLGLWGLSRRRTVRV